MKPNKNRNQEGFGQTYLGQLIKRVKRRVGLNNGLLLGKGVVAPQPADQQKNPTISKYVPPQWPEEEGICFSADEMRKGKPWASAVKRRIVNKIILEHDLIQADNVEVAEFAGMVATMKSCKAKGLTHTIYSESDFAVWSVKNDPAGLHFNGKNLSANDQKLVDDAVEWLRANPEHNDCKKWDKAWGSMQYYLMGEAYYYD